MLIWVPDGSNDGAGDGYEVSVIYGISDNARRGISNTRAGERPAPALIVVRVVGIDFAATGHRGD